MEIYQVKVFLEVARRLSFTEAADALSLTQPAVSAKIKSLESELGTELFHRSGRKIEMTSVGQYLLEFGPRLLDLETQIIQGIDEIKLGKFRRLRVGCTISISNAWIPNILFEYRQKYPEIELKCLTFETVKSLHNAITLGDIEVGFSEISLEEFDEVKFFPVDSFRYFLTVAADHRLANCQWLSIQDLLAETWVFPADETPERIVLEARLSELGLKLSDFPRQEIVQSSSLMDTFLTQGHYLGFSSSLQFKAERRAKLLKNIPLQEFPLDSKLFMLASKEVSRRVFPPSHKALSAQEPLEQFIHLVTERSQYRYQWRSRIESNPTSATELSLSETKTNIAIASSPSPPIYLQSPNLLSRSSHSPSEAITLTIGTQNKTIQTVTAGLIIQRLGLLEHFLPREGKYRKTEYRIKWRDFTSGAPIVAGLNAQELDIGILGDYPLLLSAISPPESASSAPNPTRLISFVASNPDGAGNAIIVPHRSSIQSLDDFRSRVVAVPFASSAHGMLLRSLSREQLLKAVTLTSIENLSLQRLTPRNARADGYAYFAPLHEIASHQGKFRQLQEIDSTKIPTFHGVVARSQLIDAYPEIIIAYLKALAAAQYWYVTTPSALSLVSKWVKLDPKIVAKTLDYRKSNTSGLFFPETQIRMDWIAEHIQQLAIIPGNESIAKLDLESWIRPEFLESALSAL